MELQFDICDGIDFLDEGVDFSLRLGSEGDWIPINFLLRFGGNGVYRNSLSGISLNTPSSPWSVREYLSDLEFVTSGSNYQYSVKICDFDFPMEFRWLQTSSFETSSNSVKDMWSLDDVDITYQADNMSVCLLHDSFDGPQLK